MQKKRSGLPDVVIWRDLRSKIDLWATLWGTSSEARRSDRGEYPQCPFSRPRVARRAVPAQNHALQSTLMGTLSATILIWGDRRTSLNATASRTPVIFSHDVDHGDRDRCWAFDLFLLRATEHGPSWIGSRRLGCPYLARGPCDPVLACSSINIECNVATFHMEFVQRLAGVKSPFDFVEICQNHSRQKFETLTRAS